MLLLMRGLNQDRLLYIIQYHTCRSWKVVGEALLLFSRFVCSRIWLDSTLGHYEQQRQRHTLGFLVVICHAPCAGERKTMAGTVNHDFLCSGGEVGRTKK